jgi:hypothetical protein
MEFADISIFCIDIWPEGNGGGGLISGNPDSSSNGYVLLVGILGGATPGGGIMAAGPEAEYAYWGGAAYRMLVGN